MSHAMQSSSNFPLRRSGIYRNLPTIDPNAKNLTAIVTGATGLSGWNTIRSMLDYPEQRWTKIFAISRNAPPKELMSLLSLEQQKRIQHVPINLLDSPEDIAKALQFANVSATHVFFYAYLQPKLPPGAPVWSNADEMVSTNTKILSNFLGALPLANTIPRRVLLQTGCKNYGIQFGRARAPNVESDPQPRHCGPNFYYPQEDILKAFCHEQQGTSWNVIRPGAVMGAVTSAQMNSLYVLGIYAVVQAQKNEPLIFPGDWDVWQQDYTMSNARLTGYLSEWAALQENCRDQDFNAQDDSPTTWDRVFHELARWYNIEKGVEGPLNDVSKMTRVEMKGAVDSPMGYGPPVVAYKRFTLTDWAKDPVNAKAWREACEKSECKIVSDPFADVDYIDDLFGIADVLFLRFPTASMNKAKIYGWTGFVDSLEGCFEGLQDFERLGLLPGLKVDSARPMV